MTYYCRNIRLKWKWSRPGDFFSMPCIEKVTSFMVQAMKGDISAINYLLRSQFIAEVTASA